MFNIAFVAELFKKESGLIISNVIKELIQTSDEAKNIFNITNLTDSIKIDSKDRKTRCVLFKNYFNKLALLSWINSFGTDPFVQDIFDDLRDGIILLKVLFCIM